MIRLAIESDVSNGSSEIKFNNRHEDVCDNSCYIDVNNNDSDEIYNQFYQKEEDSVEEQEPLHKRIRLEDNDQE